MRTDDTTSGPFSTGISWADVPWGTHLCQFYETSDDLLEVLVPFFAEGLGTHDCGLWVVSAPLSVEQAIAALRQAIPELDAYLADGQMVIVSHEEWYLQGAALDTSSVLAAWQARTSEACARGFRGLRASGSGAALKNEHWNELLAYESCVQAAISGQRMIALCTYPLAQCNAAEFMEVVRVHDYAIVRRNGEWESLESTSQKHVEQALRKHAEKALRESEERLRTVLETSPDAIARLGLDGRILLANRQAVSLAGFESLEQMLVHTQSIFDLLAAEDHARARENIRALPDVNIHRDVQYCAQRRDGSRFPAEVSVSLERDAAGKPKGMILVLRDVSARKQADEELHERRRQAEAANRAKSEFLANVSHEIRTPMTAILGFSDLLMSPNLGQREQHEFLAGIRRNGLALMELIDAILELSRVEADRLTLKEARWPLRPLVEGVIEALQDRASEKGLRLEAEFHEPLPELIRTDSARLGQILASLVGNALKFTEHGEVRVTVDQTEGSGGARRVRFAVRDTGIGIPAEKLDDLFQPFMQVDGSATRRYGGAGLGLVIARRLAQALGGSIEVTSRLGEGSTFTLVIKVVTVDDERPTSPPPGIAAGVASVSITAAFSGSRTSLLR
jgi:PAS domain S-box-containing protein